MQMRTSRRRRICPGAEVNMNGWACGAWRSQPSSLHAPEQKQFQEPAEFYRLDGLDFAKSRKLLLVLRFTSGNHGRAADAF
jgi:hypothetical protein